MTILKVDPRPSPRRCWLTGRGPSWWPPPWCRRRSRPPSARCRVPTCGRSRPSSARAARSRRPSWAPSGTLHQEMIEESGGRLTVNDRVGLSGLQARYDEQLRGVPLVRVDLVPRSGASASPSASPAPEKALFQQDESVGAGITLSLDRDLQTKAEEVLSTQAGMAALVVLDIKTGGILAAAQSPAGGTYPHVTYGNYAPGSTFKTVSALAMLRSGLTPSSLVNCPSSLTVGTYTFGNYSGYPSSALGPDPAHHRLRPILQHGLRGRGRHRHRGTAPRRGGLAGRGHGLRRGLHLELRHRRARQLDRPGGLDDRAGAGHHVAAGDGDRGRVGRGRPHGPPLAGGGQDRHADGAAADRSRGPATSRR